jgi:hypothetical protein
VETGLISLRAIVIDVSDEEILGSGHSEGLQGRYVGRAVIGGMTPTRIAALDAGKQR